MENIKDNKSYKRLKSIERALKLVLEMRSYSIVLEQDKESIAKDSLSNYITTYSTMQNAIEEMVKEQTTGLLDWSNLDDIEDIFNELNALLKSHPEAKDEVRELSLRIATLENTCPNLRAIPIEIMMMASKLNIGREEASEFRNAILKLLNSLSYDKAKDVRDYLTTSCTVSSFYLAFYKNNSTACGKDVQENFSSLINSMIDSPLTPRIGLLDKAFREYYKARGVSLDKKFIKSFLTIESPSEFSNTLLDVLRSHFLLASEGFIDTLEEILDEYTRKDESFYKWYDIFSQYSHIAGTDSAVQAFASYLARTDNQNKLGILSYALWKNGREDLDNALISAFNEMKSEEEPKMPKLNPKN